MFFTELTRKDVPEIISCLEAPGTPKHRGQVAIANSVHRHRKNLQIIKKYFNLKWVGFGAWEEVKIINPQTGLRVLPHKILVGYCFIKNPKSRPETMTVVHSDYRSKGIARSLRDFALSQREKFKGHIVYSSVSIDNPASLKSVLSSRFFVFDITKDGYIQLIKVLEYQ